MCNFAPHFSYSDGQWRNYRPRHAGGGGGAKGQGGPLPLGKRELALGPKASPERGDIVFAAECEVTPLLMVKSKWRFSLNSS